jgi:LPS sulfotransferase NodH
MDVGWIGRWLATRPKDGRRGYAICTVPRTGSSVLCEWLSSTGKLGCPFEYFHTEAGRRIIHPNYPDDHQAQLDWILTKGSTSNGIYGVKVFAHQHEAVAQVLDWTRALPRLHYVLLERRDRLGQAISWLRAAQSGRFQSWDAPRGEIRYDGPTLRNYLKEVDRQYAFWSGFVRRHRIRPLRLFYEDALDDPQQAVDQIAMHFGLAGLVHVSRVGIALAIQRDATTEEWRARYLAEIGEPAMSGSRK